MPKRNNLKVKILSFLKRTLPADRFKHVCGVMDFGRRLARAHGLDQERMELAGVLHDTARCWPAKKLIQYIRKHRVQAPDLEFTVRHQPVLLHSYVGSDIARWRFKIKDREILSAVAKHSLGAVQMTPFEKAVYVADHLAPDRTFSGVSKSRRKALKDLDQAFIEGVRHKMEYLLKIGAPLHPESVRVWNHFVLKEKKQNR